MKADDCKVKIIMSYNVVVSAIRVLSKISRYEADMSDSVVFFISGHSCSPPGALLEHTSNRPHVAEEKSYWRWKIAERCPLRYGTCSTTL
jgi:hypothetical protein